MTKPRLYDDVTRKVRHTLAQIKYAEGKHAQGVCYMSGCYVLPQEGKRYCPACREKINVWSRARRARYKRHMEVYRRVMDNPLQTQREGN